MLKSIKQFFNYTKEFRISAPEKLDLDNSLEKIVKLLKSKLADNASHPDNNDTLLKLASEIGTTIWRLKRRLRSTTEDSDTVRRINLDLESVWDALTQVGIEIKDHTGEKYDSGMALDVLTFQPTSGITREQIIETIKPTVYHKNKLVRIGQVIVGVPETALSEDTPK